MESRIGQMIMTGFRGEEIDSQAPVIRDIRNGFLGGVILFDRDWGLKSDSRNIRSPQQVKNLISRLQRYTAIPLLVAVDQEGGKVCRLKEEKDFPPTLSQEELGKMNDLETTAHYARLTSASLAAAGFNLNLAPVVDLNLNPGNPIIGRIGRSFSANPEIVIRHARIVIDAHHLRCIATTLKHFPGHGSSTTDSHLELPDITRVWKEVELVPFGRIVSEGKADLIMTAHVVHSRLDAEYPATLSGNVITGILRRKLEFRGVVISDDLQMKAITDHFGLEKAVELAINAGVDILTFGNNLVYDEEIAPKVMNIIRQLLKDRIVTPERINASYQRIMALKRKFGLL